MATIVHAADLHIDSPAQGPMPDPGVPRATRRAVVRLVTLTLAIRANLLVVAGDVFDRQADTEAAGRFFAGQMRRLHEAGVPVLVAAGNHDAVCPRATGYPAGVRWFRVDRPDSHVFNDLGVAVHGQGLVDPGEPGDLTVGFPPPLPSYTNLGVLHTSLDGRASRSRCAPTSVGALAATGYDYWALGHVHERRVVATHPWIVFPGNAQGRGPDEPGAKGATVVTTARGTVTGVTHRVLASLRWNPVPEAPAAAPVPVAP